MSDAASIQSRRTTWPRMSSPRISLARASASSGIGRELDAAGLAAPAGQHLRLDDDLAAELLRRLPRLLGSRREPPVGDGDPVAREELLALILVEVQSGRESILRACCGSAFCSSLVLLVTAGCGTDEQPEPASPARPAEPQTAELGWREAYPSTGPQLRFLVDRLVVREDGWSADIAVENATAIPFGLATRPRRARVRADALRDRQPRGARERRRGTGRCRPLRRATTIEPPRARRRSRRARPGAPRSRRPARSPTARSSASRSAPSSRRGSRRPGMEPEVVWITDKAYRSVTSDPHTLPRGAPMDESHDAVRRRDPDGPGRRLRGRHRRRRRRRHGHHRR